MGNPIPPVQVAGEGTHRGQREPVVQEVGVPASGFTDAVFVGRGQPSGQGCVGGSPPGMDPVGTEAEKSGQAGAQVYTSSLSGWIGPGDLQEPPSKTPLPMHCPDLTCLS